MFTRYLMAASLLAISLQAELPAQSQVAAEPMVGLRDNAPRDYALQHAEVVVEPGHRILDATVLVQGTSITAVGTDIKIPPGYKTIDCTGKKIYAGLIDAWGEVEVPSSGSPAAYWNSNVTPERSAATVASKSIDQAAKRRGQGFTTCVVAPNGGIVKGSSCVVLLTDSAAGRTLLKQKAWQHLQLSVPRTGSRPAYPNSPMGAVALVRQSMYDANWYRAAWDAYRARPELRRPETNVALDVLSQSIVSDTFVIDAPNERMAVRAENMAREFSLKMIVRGSGREYRQLDEIVAMNRPILVPLDFPKTPDVKTTESALNTTLQELMHWDLAPENPARLSAAGVAICLTTDGLDDVGDFLKQVRTAVERGLPPDAALAAMTTVPARLLEIEDHTGRVQPGMLANLVVADGDLLAKKTKILECWVAGERFEISAAPSDGVSQLVGTWLLKFRPGNSVASLQLVLTAEDEKLSGLLRDPDQTESKADDAKRDEKSSDDEQRDEPNKAVKLKDVVYQRDRTTATVDLHEIDSQYPEGISRLTLITVAGDQTRPTILASIALPSGQSQGVEVTFVEEKQPPPNEAAADEKSDEPETQKRAQTVTDEPEAGDPNKEQSTSVAGSTPTLFPLGAYGLPQRISDRPTVMFRGATVWTCDQAGTLEPADLLIRDGRIANIGQNLPVPAGCQIVDARGKHITPGLIDCHSHMGTDGGVNESGQAVTAEVRVGDFIDNSDITIYRQLAGGLTTSNILHGSANPIGGQNQVIKLRWGETMDGLRMKEAPRGIKFALGENVKRNESRYPNTRMGVEQIIRDQLLAAREYDAAWRRWRSGHRDSLPPRTDLQLEAMAEIQRGERWIHCHSYRQDEIVATLDVLEEFGIQIGTLQHVLEGYKVADRMARHGAMGSSFSDWWAYKFEVFDAIPFNGALMHDRGVVVSFNSDDRELARHLNTEAAKATKYGGVSAAEALKFVTLNPAKQLRIDQHVGSLAVGKHADLVVWSARPLSTLSRCEQTWIDGKRYFDLAADQAFRQRDATLRAGLIQKALASGSGSEKGSKDEVAEEDRWVRHDVFCSAHGGAEYGKGGRSQ